METVTDFILGGSKITADGDCSYEIKRLLLLGRKAMTNIDSILKCRHVTLPAKVHLVKAMVFPVVMYECESWTIEKAEHRRTDAFELWYWRTLLRVPWTARRSNQSILKEIGGGLVAKLCPTLVTPWTVACQAPLSTGFSRQEFWSGLPFPFPGNLLDPGIEPCSPALQVDSLLTEL